MQKEEQWLLKEKYNNKATKQFKKDLKRLKKGEPVDYVIGFTEFLGCKIDLSKKTLIPRKETEFWMAKVIEEIRTALALRRSAEDVKSIVQRSWGHENYKLKVLDIFAGSGCIGVSVLANVENLLCDFADVDVKAISQIKINLKNNFIKPDRYKVFKSDIFKNIKGKYDFILANPPYIPDYRVNPSARLRAILRNRIQKSVLKYEPKKALFGGKDGMSFINKFLKNAKKHLNNGGGIFMEFDPPQKKEIEKMLKKYKYKSWEFNKDQYDKLRWLSAK